MNYMLMTLAVAGAVFAIVGPAAAHQDHTSCGGGAPAVVEAGLAPIPPGPGFGDLFVKPIAQAHLAKQIIEGLHGIYCADEPGDQPPLRPQTNAQPAAQPKN